MDSSEWDASTAVAASGMDSTADEQLSVMTATAVLASPDCVGVILDFVGLDHFPACAAVSRCFCACVRDKQELWNVLRPEHLISKNSSGLVEPCHAVAMGGDLIGVLDVGGSVGGISPRLRTLCAASGEMLGTPARIPVPRHPPHPHTHLGRPRLQTRSRCGCQRATLRAWSSTASMRAPPTLEPPQPTHLYRPAP